MERNSNENFDGKEIGRLRLLIFLEDNFFLFEKVFGYMY
jgi:hypothetical protein